MIQSTSGTSMPRAATSVQMRTEARWKGERKHTLWLAELLHRACPAFLDHSSVERENASGLQARNVLQDGGKEVHGGAGEEEDDHLVGRVDLEKADELPLTETQRSYKAEEKEKKKKGRHERIMDEWEELQEEERLFKMMKKKQIT